MSTPARSPLLSGSWVGAGPVAIGCLVPDEVERGGDAVRDRDGAARDGELERGDVVARQRLPDVQLWGGEATALPAPVMAARAVPAARATAATLLI